VFFEGKTRTNKIQVLMVTDSEFIEGSELGLRSTRGRWQLELKVMIQSSM
jgi:hypothetical protein